VVGGLGLPFAAELPRRADDVWGLQVHCVNVGCFYTEADVWAARRDNCPLMLPAGDAVTGVVPLAACGPEAHSTYFDGPLQPIALLHLGAMLRGSLPEKPWGWDAQAPPFSLEVGACAREAAVLVSLAGDILGCSRVPSSSEALIVSQLFRQFLEKKDLVPMKTSADLWAADSLKPQDSTLKHFASFLATSGSEVSDKEDDAAALARLLYMMEVRRSLQRHGDAHGLGMHAQGARCDAVIKLLAEAAEDQKPDVPPEIVLKHVESRLDSGFMADIDIPIVNSMVADFDALGERLLAILWAPSMQRIAGCLRLHAHGADEGRLQQEAPPSVPSLLFKDAQRSSAVTVEAFKAAAVSFTLCPPEAAGVGIGEFAQRLAGADNLREELHSALRRALSADYELRLRSEVSKEIDRRIDELNRSIPILLPKDPRGNVSLDLHGPPPPGWNVRQSNLPHIPFVLCGSVDSGKSTLAGRLLYELGCISTREMSALRTEAERLGKRSSTFAFALDTVKQERERGITMNVKKREFFSDRFQFSLIDVPGHRNYCKATLNGIFQADVAILVVTLNASDFAKPIHRAGLQEGQARSNARSLYVMGVKQLIVCVNKMDACNFSSAVYDEVTKECKKMLQEVGFSTSFIKNVPFIPVASWLGDNLVHRSEAMPWWSGTEVEVNHTPVRITTLADALNEACLPAARQENEDFIMPITGVFNIRGVGSVVTGRVLQGRVTCEEMVQFTCTAGSSTASRTPASIRVKSIEMHHRQREVARAGDIVGLSLPGLRRGDAEVGDVLTRSGYDARPVRTFTAVISAIGAVGELNPGWTPLCFAHTVHAPVRMRRVEWKDAMHGMREENPAHIKRNETALVEFKVRSSNFYIEPFNKSTALGRLIFMDGAFFVNVRHCRRCATIAIGRVMTVES